jgi:hypothetical protein
VDVSKVESEDVLLGNMDPEVIVTGVAITLVGIPSFTGVVGAGAGTTVAGSINVVPGSAAVVGNGSIIVVGVGTMVVGSSSTVVVPGSTVVSDMAQRVTLDYKRITRMTKENQRVRYIE